jgi:hypothetical protein
LRFGISLAVVFEYWSGHRVSVLIAGIHRPSLLVAQAPIVLPDPEKPATNDLFAAEEHFAPI